MHVMLQMSSVWNILSDFLWIQTACSLYNAAHPILFYYHGSGCVLLLLVNHESGLAEG